MMHVTLNRPRLIDHQRLLIRPMDSVQPTDGVLSFSKVQNHCLLVQQPLHNLFPCFVSLKQYRELLLDRSLILPLLQLKHA